MAETRNNRPPMQHGPRGGIRMIEKPKDFKKSIKQLFLYVKSMWLQIILSLLFAAAGTVLSIIGPKMLLNMQEPLKAYIANPSVPIDFETISKFGLILAIIYLLSFLFSSFQSFIMSGVTARISKKFRSDITKKINRLPLRYFDKNTYGDVLSRVTNDVDTISHTLNGSLSTLITSIAMIIGVPIMMFTISAPLAGISLISVPVTLLLTGLVVKLSQKYFIKQQKSLGEINGQIEEIYSAHNIVRTFNGQDKANKNFETVNAELYKTGYKAQFLSGLMMPAMRFVGNLVYLVICIVGAMIAIDSANPAFVLDITVFLIYVKLFNQPLQQIGNVANTLQSAAAAAERVFEFLEEEEQENEEQKSETIKNIQGVVEFKDVVFGYTKEKEIIHGLSFKAERGQKIAIVGPTGAGKTTLVNLLMRFYEIDSGEILIDGINTKEMKRGDVRSLFGMVLQDSWLFDGTIKDNLKFGRPEATDEEVIECSKKSNIDHVIRTLPGGYEMRLDEKSNLSQGERQLLTIARAMVQNSPMLILDEATSSVDTRTEQLIQDAMDKLMEGRTSFVIAHRLSTIKNADLILVMDSGNVIEQGNHDELMKKNGFYAKLYNSQFTKKVEVED